MDHKQKMQQLSQFKPNSSDVSMAKSHLRQAAEQALLKQGQQQQSSNESMDMKISMQLNKNISVKVQQPQAL